MNYYISYQNACRHVFIAVKLVTWLQNAGWHSALKLVLEIVTNVDPHSTLLRIARTNKTVS